MAFYLSISSPQQTTDGKIHVMPATGIVDFYLLNGSHVTGTHSRPSRAFSLTIHDGTGTILIGTVSLSLSEKLF